MAIKSDEQLYSGLARGMQAASDLSIVEPIITERRNDLIAGALAAFNSLIPEKRLTDRDAALFVARLAEGQAILDKLQKIRDDGARDGKKLSS